jgi:hypothetical protein
MPQACATAKANCGRTRAPPGKTAWRTAPANLGGQLGSSADAKAMAKHCSIFVIAFMGLSPLNVEAIRQVTIKVVNWICQQI